MKNFCEKFVVGIIILLYKIFNFFLEICRFILFGFKIPKNIRKIIVFRTGNIGDTICAVPAMVVIRNSYPNAFITLLSSPGKQGMVGAKELLHGAGFLDNLIVYYKEDISNFKKIFNLIKKIRKEKFDLFIELPQNLVKSGTLIRNVLFAKSIGCRYAFGFQLSTIKIFKRLQSKYLFFDNEVERLINILKKYKIFTNKISFPFPIFESDRKRVNSFLEGMNKETKIIAINPGAKRQTNIWPQERFAEVGRWLIENFNVQIVITGGKNDKERSEELKNLIGDKVINVAGELSVLQTIELLKHCRLLISNDTGAVHMAVAAGIPVVGIYSARDFKNKWYPYGENSIVIRKEINCQVCFLERCKHLTCLKKISVDEVSKTVRHLKGF